MEVVDKINYLLKEKKISKKEFIKSFRDLEPRLKSTGEIPSESTIYGYLNGGREIKVELISYIADALQVNEQELFVFDIEYASSYNVSQSKEIRTIIELLQYLPISKVNELKDRLEEYKVLFEKKM